MKKLFTFFVLMILFTSSFAQDASTYFPSQTGFEWKFKVTPLDSANNRVEPLSFYRIDLFSSTANYKGQMANIIESKNGPLETVLQQPFTDSMFFYPSGTNGYVYLSSKNIEPFLITLDEQNIIPNFSFVTFFASLQNWYSTFRFGSAVNTEYLILQKDTTLKVSIFTIPVQFKYLGTRLSDETIQTVKGSYTCKKFLLQWKIVSSFLGGDLITLKDTIWIAQGNYIVQDIMPGQYVNNSSLTMLGVQPFSIPGFEMKLTDQISAVDDEGLIPVTAHLEQNYPNPFNPSTKIVFSIPQRSKVSLKVYNLLGTEVADLVNGEMEAGRYETKFDASSLTSGVYFYKLQAENFVETKKMLLIK